MLSRLRKRTCHPLRRLPSSPILLSHHQRPPLSLPSNRQSSSKRTPHAPPKAQKEPKSFLNELIPHETIILFDLTTRELSSPTPLHDALLSLDRSRYNIFFLDGAHRPAICRIEDVKLGYTKHLDKLEKKGTFGGYKGKDNADWRAFVKAPPLEEEEGSPAAFNETFVKFDASEEELRKPLASARKRLANGGGMKVVVVGGGGSHLVKEKVDAIKEKLKAEKLVDTRTKGTNWKTKRTTLEYTGRDARR